MPGVSGVRLRGEHLGLLKPLPNFQNEVCSLKAHKGGRERCCPVSKWPNAGLLPWGLAPPAPPPTPHPTLPTAVSGVPGVEPGFLGRPLVSWLVRGCFHSTWAISPPAHLLPKEIWSDCDKVQVKRGCVCFNSVSQTCKVV